MILHFYSNFFYFSLFYFITANSVLYFDIVAEIVNKISPTAHFLHLGKWGRYYTSNSKLALLISLVYG